MNKKTFTTLIWFEAYQNPEIDYCVCFKIVFENVLQLTIVTLKLFGFSQQQ